MRTVTQFISIENVSNFFFLFSMKHLFDITLKFKIFLNTFCDELLKQIHEISLRVRVNLIVIFQLNNNSYISAYLES